MTDIIFKSKLVVDDHPKEFEGADYFDDIASNIDSCRYSHSFVGDEHNFSFVPVNVDHVEFTPV